MHRRGELEHAVAEAFALRRTTRAQLIAIVERHPRRPGVPGLRRLLEAGHAPARTHSRAERRLLALIRAAKLPEPDVNARVGRWEVDFLWHERRVVVEFDGYASHSSPRAFERDHVKTAELEDAGFEVARVSGRQLRDRPQEVTERITRRLREPASL